MEHLSGIPVETEAVTAFAEVEQTLTKALFAWSAASIVIGSACAAAGASMSRPNLVSFGRQTAAWGAIDGLLAGAGELSRRRRGHLDVEQERAKAKGLRRLLLINAVADVGYVAAGTVIAARGRAGRRTARMRAGDGIAIVIQGAFLLGLDASQAKRLL